MLLPSTIDTMSEMAGWKAKVHAFTILNEEVKCQISLVSKHCSGLIWLSV